MQACPDILLFENTVSNDNKGQILSSQSFPKTMLSGNTAE